ncbi:MAG: hypothetical protein WC869_11220 [Phycisphaerae bacterium]|jgi:hypothetical protein
MNLEYGLTEAARKLDNAIQTIRSAQATIDTNIGQGAHQWNMCSTAVSTLEECKTILRNVQNGLRHG